jgi:DNA-binding FadR family transcriptional regulator
LRNLIGKMQQKIATGEDFLVEDLEFHRAIYQVTGNRLLIKLLDIFRSVYQQLHDHSLHVSVDPQDEWQNHNAILQAIETRDADLAQQRLRTHFEGIKERLHVARLANTDRE